MALDCDKNKNIILKFGKCPTNSGLTEVQIALFSNKIDQLQKHFLKNKKDFHSKRGLLKIISKRRRLLNYLKNEDFSRYSDIIKKLNLRS